MEGGSRSWEGVAGHGRKWQVMGGDGRSCRPFLQSMSQELANAGDMQRLPCSAAVLPCFMVEPIQWCGSNTLCAVLTAEMQ